jgi:hypothetical protein
VFKEAKKRKKEFGKRKVFNAGIVLPLLAEMSQCGM